MQSFFSWSSCCQGIWSTGQEGMAVFTCLSDHRGSVIFPQLIPLLGRAHHDTVQHLRSHDPFHSRTMSYPFSVVHLLHLTHKHSNNSKTNRKAQPMSRRHHSKLSPLLHRYPRDLLLLLQVLPCQEQQPRNHNFFHRDPIDSSGSLS
jgi:hypothetical protein